jgi:hypothetical protein
MTYTNLLLLVWGLEAAIGTETLVLDWGPIAHEVMNGGVGGV